MIWSKKKITFLVFLVLFSALVWLYPIFIPCSNKSGVLHVDLLPTTPESLGTRVKETLQEWLPPLSCVEARQMTGNDLINLKNISSSLLVSYDKIKIFDAWDVMIGSSLFPFQSTTTIGIIDSGVDAATQSSHPEFVGVDFGKSSPFARVDRASEVRSDLVSGHGTAVAGIIGANNISAHQEYIFPQMNGILSGVTEKYILESRVGIYPDNLTTLWAATTLDSFPADSIVNMSIGIPVKDEDFIYITKHFSQLFKKNSDKLFIVSAGNDGEDALVSIPANVIEDNVLVVGATDINDNRAHFSVGSSNYGATVNISAPGEKIYAPVIQGRGSFPASGQYQNDYQKDFRTCS